MQLVLSMAPTLRRMKDQLLQRRILRNIKGIPANDNLANQNLHCPLAQPHLSDPSLFRQFGGQDATLVCLFTTFRNISSWGLVGLACMDWHHPAPFVSGSSFLS